MHVLTSLRKAWMMQQNRVVALALDEAGHEDQPVAIKLRVADDRKEVCASFYEAQSALSLPISRLPFLHFSVS